MDPEELSTVEHGANGVASMFSSLFNWAKQPFSETMDLSSWFLFVGLILAFVFSWHLVLRDLKGHI